MKLLADKTRYFLVQVIFFALSTLVLHLALFDFLGFYQERNYPETYTLKDDLWHWLPVIILDLFVGVTLGILNALFTLIIKDAKYIMTLMIVTDFIWILFCLWWYFNNRGVINLEAIGHVISPFMVGFAGGLSALITLMLSLALNRNTNLNKDADKAI